MTPHIQTVTDDGTGNCFATCIACILDVPAESVSNFKAMQEDDNNFCMVDAADQWLRDNHGRRFVSVELYDPADGPNKGHPLTTQCILNRLCHRNGDELVILSGESPRRRADGARKYHCVIGRPTVWGFEVVHDPHPDGGGIIGQPYGVKWMVPVMRPSGDGLYSSMIQNIKVSTNLGREELFELGRRGPYHHYVSFEPEAGSLEKISPTPSGEVSLVAAKLASNETRKPKMTTAEILNEVTKPDGAPPINTEVLPGLPEEAFLLVGDPNRTREGAPDVRRRI